LVFRNVLVLRLSAEFSKIEIFPPRARPIGGEYTGVCPYLLSIKLDREGEDVDKNMWVEEAVHPYCGREECCLWEVLVFRQRQEGFVQVAIWQEDGGILARVGPKREDACNSSKGGHKGPIVAGVEPALNTGAIRECEEGHDKVFGVWDGVNKDGGVVR